MHELATPHNATRQPSTFQPRGLSPMQISPSDFPAQASSFRQVQPATFQPPAPRAPTFQIATLSAPKLVGQPVKDHRYNPFLNLEGHGIDTTKTGFVGNIEDLSKTNRNFRLVLYTSDKIQLVLMSLRPGQDIGSEAHVDTDQFFRIETGTGIVEINGVRRPYEDGTAIQIPKGTQHNIIAVTQTKLYTLYSPPHHTSNKIETTKQ